jgi:hypothetical protein
MMHACHLHCLQIFLVLGDILQLFFASLLQTYLEFFKIDRLKKPLQPFNFKSNQFLNNIRQVFNASGNLSVAESSALIQNKL